ncbi:acetoacetyl-CoA synthetase (plasmid) [Pseudonocardia sp. EC080610-09]|uniref:acetoacetate--CoA ligase n=1 Tax=unclassified Pseudonocardia TaxID=2619320 RepID=UPI000706206A|nr:MULTISPECIES: acetoacetate--CoA ligase [unclassified Pseudonocardia]ALL79593.1 acetoacetyl-CoA synthetase [Pseudonocardia sp. EC080610-09]ALL85453.1 acetoacetyl-CoA synthetase [Pseudonocardia sp. EC080619-01]
MTILREPDPDVLDSTAIGDFVTWLRARGHGFDSYDELWRWSVADPAAFWAAVRDHFGVDGLSDEVLADPVMPGARWFPGSALNYAEHLLRACGQGEGTVVIGYSQTRPTVEVSGADLAEQVARCRTGLVRLGVGRGDRVVAYLPNVPETLVAFLACASLGAVWASCAPEFGARSVVDRFAQLEPSVLLTVPGYTYGDKQIDRTAEVAAIRAGLPTLRHVVAVPYGPGEVPGAVDWPDLLATSGELTFERVEFHHPLYVLFSSGTTGLPKAIVHGHGGILLEHLKTHALHLDLRPGDRFCWFTTTAWTMWNILVSGLLRGAGVVLVDGNPMFPDLGEQWRIAADAGVSHLGTSPGYVMACRKEATVLPALPSLRMLGITGAPLPDDGFDWAAERLGQRVIINSMSGGTDICSGFVAGNPWLPVRRGELAGPCLGVDITVFDPDGHEIVDEIGELVVRRPMPSMPVRFWNDDGDRRYRASYFDTYPGVWRHGDWATRTRHGGFVISGRSDATLNRGGVRLGTAEFYAVVEELSEIADSLVVHLEDPAGGPGRLLLFLVPVPGAEVDDALRARVRTALRTQLSPRHVPDTIEAVPAIPRTMTGKKLETPIKQILQGRAVADVVSPGAVDRPDTLAAFLPTGATR